VSPAENSKPPSGGSITNERCLTHSQDAAHSESVLQCVATYQGKDARHAVSRLLECVAVCCSALQSLAC